jgi:periplasmic divalent cation tolerance protein
MADVLLTLCTCPDTESAAWIGRALVGEGLAACVTCVPGATSIYRWQGMLHEDAEVLLLIKTTAARFAALQARVLALHPYDVPEIVAVDIAAGHGPYLDWLRAAVADPAA